MTENPKNEGDINARPDVIQKPMEYQNIKTTMKDLEAVTLFVHWLGKQVYIGTNQSLEMKSKLIEFLRANADYFAWSHSNMIDIPQEVMTHKLNEDLLHLHIKQKKRK